MAVSKLCILCVMCVLFVALSDSANINDKAKGHARMDLANPLMRKAPAAKGDLMHHARMDSAKHARRDHLKKRTDSDEEEEDEGCDSDVTDTDSVDTDEMTTEDPNATTTSSPTSEDAFYEEKKKRRMSARLAHGKSRSGGAPKPKAKPSAKAAKL